MKTIDEVIECLRVCGRDEPAKCPYFDSWHWECCNPGDRPLVFDDALYYLKTIETTENLYHDAVNELSKWKDEDWKDRCLPLTWDELREMEGKPVWVEVDGNWYGKFWAFIEVVNVAYMNFYQKGQEYPEDLWKRDLGKTWQAYRKERE